LVNETRVAAVAVQSAERFESRAISGSSTTESTESAEAYENGRVRIRIWNLHHSSKGR
jgi:hypothetical protein